MPEIPYKIRAAIKVIRMLVRQTNGVKVLAAFVSDEAVLGYKITPRELEIYHIVSEMTTETE